MLIDKNANYTEKQNNGANLFHTSVFYNDNSNIMKLLVEALISKNNEIDLKQYLEGVTDHKQTPLHTASRYNKPLIIEYLIYDLGVNKEAKDHKNRTPLTIAAEFGV